MENWLPPLDGEEPEELKEEEVDSGSESQGDKEVAETGAPPAPVKRTTRQQTLKEPASRRKQASPARSQEVDSKEESSSSGVRALSQAPTPVKRKSPPPADEAGGKEHRAAGAKTKRAAG